MEFTTTRSSGHKQEISMVKPATEQWVLGAASIIGNRETQQDSFLFEYLPVADTRQDRAATRALVAVVADGVGGAVSGDIASRLAAEYFVSTSDELYNRGEPAARLLSTALTAANRAISQAIHEDRALGGMATTLVGVLVDQQGLVWASVGDSHLYLLRHGQIEKLNKDHSLGALIDDQYAKGEISREEAENSLYRNVILSCLSGEKIELIDINAEPFALHAGDRILLASDGLDTLSTEEILDICVETPDSQRCADRLLEQVKDRDMPHQDNTTVLVIDCT